MADPSYSKISSILAAIGESGKLGIFTKEEFKDDLLDKITDPDDRGLKEGLQLSYGFRARFADELLKRRASEKEVSRAARKDSGEDQLEGPSTNPNRSESASQTVVNVTQATFKQHLDLKGDLTVTQGIGDILDKVGKLAPGTRFTAQGLIVGDNATGQNFTISDQAVVVQPVQTVSSSKVEDTAEDSFWNRLGRSRINKKATEIYEKGPGYVLIINNMFEGMKLDGKDSERYGTEKDGAKMEKLFKDTLNCQVIAFEDVKKDDLQKKLDFFKNSVPKESKYVVVILMTHGGQEVNSVLMNDLKPVNLYKDLIYQFSNQKFPQFKNKPKIFLLQMCQAFVDEVDSTTEPSGRGSAKDIEIMFHNPEDFEKAEGLLNEPEVATDSIGWKGHLSHALIAFAAIPYTYALRRNTGEKIGAYFFREILKAFSKENLQEYDLEDLLKMVGENLEQQTKSAIGQRPQMSGYLNRGFRRFMFL